MFVLGVIVALAGLVLIVSAVRRETLDGHLGARPDPAREFLLGCAFLAAGPPLVLLLAALEHSAR